MDIYIVLSNRSHNPHYLNRYIRFIRDCQQKNIDYDGYTEKHHICPKSLFPEYKCFKENPWNKAILTSRQHFIAHLILEKVFDCFEMKLSLNYMSNNKWKQFKKYSKIYERLIDEIRHILSDTVVIKNADGKFKRIPKNLFLSGGYEGATKGMVSSIDLDGNRYMISKKEFLQNENIFGICFNKVPCIDTEGNYLHVTKEEFYSRDDLISMFKNKVPCIDTKGNYLHVTKEEFYSRDDLKHPRKDKVLCKDKQGKKHHVTKEEFYSRNDLISYINDTVFCKDKSNNLVSVSKEEFLIRDDLISCSKLRYLNKIKCKNLITNKIVWLTEEEYRNKPEYIIKFVKPVKDKINTKGIVRARDKKGNIITVTTEEFHSRDDLVGSNKGSKHKTMKRLKCEKCGKQIAQNRFNIHTKICSDS